MNLDVGSIMKQFYELFPCKIYQDELPESFMVPSMYFPPASSFDESVSNNAFAEVQTLSVKLFHVNKHEAVGAAERIVRAIRSKRGLIPVFNADGTPANDFVRITRSEVRAGDGFVSIILNWTNRYFFEREAAVPVQSITNKPRIKE